MTETFRFEEIGLETRDKRVYEALVASPQSSLRKLAADTGINRGSVYESIKKLAEQGLVGSIEVGKQRRYTASNPDVIIELLRERQEQATAARALAEAGDRGRTGPAGRRAGGARTPAAGRGDLCHERPCRQRPQREFLCA